MVHPSSRSRPAFAGVAHERHDLVAALPEPRGEPSAHESGRTGDERPHVRASAARGMSKTSTPSLRFSQFVTR